MQRYLLYMASLAVCALLLLSACGGQTPIAGRGAETVTPASPATVVPSTEPPASPGSPTAGVSPSPAATATETPPTPPPATATPTGTPIPPPATPAPPATPTSTEAPTATSTPEALAAPRIEGLKLVDGKYVAEKGNPYGLKLREEVGYPTSVQVKGFGGTRVRNPDGSFEEVGFTPHSAVVISNLKVLSHFMKDANTHQNVEGGEWQVPVPFKIDPNTLMWVEQTPSGATAINFNNLPLNVSVVNPYPVSLQVIGLKPGNGLASNTTFEKIKFMTPPQYAPYQGVNWGPGLIFRRANSWKINIGAFTNVSPGTTLIKGINGFLDSSVYGKNVQAQLHIGSTDLNKAGSFSLSNILTVDGAFVSIGT